MTDAHTKTIENWPLTPDDLMAQMTAQNIAFTLYHHEAVFTVEESDKIDTKIPGTHCRNLFLRDKKKNNYLISLANETTVDIKKLGAVIGAQGRLSFGSADRLWEYLGVRPGSVCPFAILNDQKGDVRLILDHDMMQTARVNFHPLLNTMTVGLAPDDLLGFLKNEGRAPQILDLSAAAP